MVARYQGIGDPMRLQLSMHGSGGGGRGGDRRIAGIGSERRIGLESEAEAIGLGTGMMAEMVGW